MREVLLTGSCLRSMLLFYFFRYQDKGNRESFSLENETVINRISEWFDIVKESSILPIGKSRKLADSNVSFFWGPVNVISKTCFVFLFIDIGRKVSTILYRQADSYLERPIFHLVACKFPVKSFAYGWQVKRREVEGRYRLDQGSPIHSYL